MDTNWKTIPGYSNYFINTKGTVFSAKSKKKLKPSVEKSGYHTVTLYSNKKGKTFTVHRLMADVFIDSPVVHKKTCVNHKNGKKTDNRLSNLEVITYSQNTKHGYDIGIMPSRGGESNGSSKITESEAYDIIKKLNKGIKASDIIIETGISKHIVYDIKYKRTWEYLHEKLDEFRRNMYTSEEESDEQYASRSRSKGYKS